jgi:hypothetical protein
MMGNLKSLIFLQAYQDTGTSNNPQFRNFQWTREVDNDSISTALSETFQIPAGTTQSLFNGVRTLTQDGTTEYSLAPIPFSTTSYSLTYESGTAAGFRTLRSIGTDATTQVTTSVNGVVETFTFTGGTLPSLSSVQVGDQVLIGSNFNPLNRGIWTIISVTTTSFSIVNGAAFTEGPITLGSGFATQLRIFSSSGVQIGDTLVISSGFSPVSQNSYQVTQVTDYSLTFAWAGNALPTEGPIDTEIAVYYAFKSMVYMESDQSLELLINGANSGPIITPYVSNGKVYPGVFLINSSIYSLSVANTSITQANITLISTS